MKIREEIERIKSIMNLTESFPEGLGEPIIIEPEIRGVTYELDDWGEYWELYELIVHGKQEKSLGSRFMRKLTQLADEHEKIVFTQASSAMGSDLNRLINFYERFGFKKVETSHNNNTLQVMRRDPKS
jgi:hypothetical protein